MKNKKFIFSFALSSFIVSSAVLAGSLYAHSLTDFGWIFNAAVVGLILSATAFLSFAAVHLLNRMRKRIKVQLPKLFSGFTAIMLALLFVLGAIGQIVYSFGLYTHEVQTGEEEKRETVEFADNADIFLVLDRSGSLEDINVKVEAACINFLDSISEDCNMGGGSFASTNNFITFRKMDKKGKDELKNAIECKNANIGNQTNLDDAFEAALNEFKKSDPKKKKAIVLFTDGVLGNLDTDPNAIDSSTGKKPYEKYQKMYKEIVDQGIELYTIRPDENFYKSHYEISLRGKRNLWCSEALLKCVKDSGGADYSVIPNDANSSEKEQKAAIEEITKILNDIAKRQEEKVTKIPIYETKTDIVFSKGLILYDSFDEQNAYRLIVRICFFVVYSVLIHFLIFRKSKIISIFYAVVTPALAWLCVWAGSVTKMFIIAALGLSLFMFTMIVFGKQDDTDKEKANTEERNNQNEKT